MKGKKMRTKKIQQNRLRKWRSLKNLLRLRFQFPYSVFLFSNATKEITRTQWKEFSILVSFSVWVNNVLLPRNFLIPYVETRSFTFQFKFRTDLSTLHERLHSRNSSVILKAYFLLHAVFWSTQFVYKRGISR